MQIRKKVNVVIGRFQPFTNGHLEMSKEMLKNNNLPCIYIYVRSKSGKNSHLNENITDTMMKSIVNKYSHIEDAFSMTASFIPVVIMELQRRGYEPINIGAGPDRFQVYQDMVKKMTKIEVDENFSIYPFKKRISNISGTQVRNFIIENDYDNFAKNTPSCTHKFFEDYRKDLVNNENKEFCSETFFGINEEHNLDEGQLIITKKILKSMYRELGKVLKTPDSKEELDELIQNFLMKQGIHVQ
jgi:hypothetical protein